MMFPELKENLYQAQKVKRVEWSSNKWVEFNFDNSAFVLYIDGVQECYWIPEVEDLFATDWEVK